MKLKAVLERCAPLGIDLNAELRWLAVGGIANTVASAFQFLGSYVTSRRALYLWDGGSRILNPRGVMPDFACILGRSLNGFLVLGVFMVAIAGYHYAYHFHGSKSIYLMRRLPKRLELARRCLTLPLLGIVACILSAFILLLIYFGIYMAFTPSVCLTPNQWHKTWSSLLGAMR